MKRNRQALVSAITLTSLLLFGFGAYFVWHERFWPFSNGTHDEAFLGSTFGMSPQEVRRAIAKHGAQLLTYEEYKKIESSPSIVTWGHLLFSDDRREDSEFYMPSVEMFDSVVEAEFDFRNKRLVSVGVYINPISSPDSVVSTVEARLRGGYHFSRREESRDVPGAYTLFFASPTATPSLWVNLTERERPIIILTVVHPSAQLSRKREIENRESKAFGPAK